MYTLILYYIIYYYHTKFGPLSVSIASAAEHNHRESCGASRKGGKHNKKKQNAILDDVKTVVDFITINVFIYYCYIITIIRGVVDCCCSSARYRVHGIENNNIIYTFTVVIRYYYYYYYYVYTGGVS